MKKICILFGAGADAPLGVGTGGDFARSVLGVIPEPGNTSKINNAIKNHYSRIIVKQDPWFPSYRFSSWKEDQLVKASLRRKLLDKEIKLKDEDFKSQYNEIISDKSKKERLINMYPSFMGMIENKFPTIIAPTILGQVKFWQVVSCFCRAYLFLVQQVLQREDYESFLNPTKKLIEEIRGVSKKKGDRKNYYTIVKELSSTHDFSVVTTNYTLYCEEISGLDTKHIAYVHGRIGLFESPKNLCVYDVEQDILNGDTVFPYLFIQSGIKPIIERRQIEEYSKMISFMDDAESIIITGYNLNNDDNHINSIIRSAIMKGKRVVYLAFDDGKMGLPLRKDIMKKLRIQGDANNLEWKPITSKDAYCVFKNALQ